MGTAADQPKTPLYARAAPFFAGVAVSYAALSPLTLESQGYMSETFEATERAIAKISTLAGLAAGPSPPMVWGRHGALESLLQMPFAALAPLLSAAGLPKDLGAALQLTFASAGIATVTFLWIRRVTGSAAWAHALGLATAFGSLIWPYAYIGMEPSHSLFILLAAYLVLGSPAPRTRARAGLLGVCCGFALGLTARGVFFLPALAYLLLVYARGRPPRAPEPAAGDLPGRRDTRWPHLAGAALAAVVAAAMLAYAMGTRWVSAPPDVIESSPFAIAFHALSFIASPNKGLIVFAPVTALGIFALVSGRVGRPEIARFVTLLAAGVIGGASLLVYWTDETWGPRYLHCLVAPLVVAFAAARASTPLRLRREVPFAALAAGGVAVSFLGAFFYYGTLHHVVTLVHEAKIETFQSDLRWNHVQFNFNLLLAGADDPTGAPRFWPRPVRWWYTRAPDAPADRVVDLRGFARPQPAFLTPDGRNAQSGQGMGLVVGPLALACLAFAAWKAERAPG